METPKFHIEQLTSHSPHLPTVAHWIYREWWQSNVADVEVIADRLRKQNADDRIPLTVVAVSGEAALGCASIILSDLQIRPLLSPWLAAVYVSPEFRRHGIGTALVEAAISKAKGLAVQRLYLATPDKQEFYSRLGWQPIEHDVGPRRQTIMEFVIEQKSI